LKGPGRLSILATVDLEAGILRHRHGIITASLLCALLLAGCGAQSTPDASGAASEELAAQEGDVSQTVALVNGEPLYRAFYEQNLNYLRKRLGSEPGKVEDYLNSKFDAMQMLISDELLYQEAKREGISAEDSDVHADFAGLVRSAGGEPQLLASLLAQHIDREMAIQGIRKRLTIDKFVTEKIDPTISVTREEAVEFYNQNQEALTPEALAKVHQILIRCQRDADPEVVDAAREAAESLRREILAGASFTEMARDHSEDSSASIGGSLGFVKKGALPPELDAAAFSLGPGEMSEPIRTDYGFHLVLVTERRGGEVPDFEEVETKCRERVLAGKRSAAIRALVGRLKKEAEIETYL